MPRKDLKNKPLIEAVLEVKWAVPDSAGKELPADPNYRILLGRFSERVKEAYPFHVSLPTASVPDEMVAQLVQHQFRHEAKGWPLLQIGPGVLTANETSKYTWTRFQKQCEDAVRILYDSHPEPQELRFESLSLRYIDGFQFEFEADDVYSYLSKMLKTTVTLPRALFTDGRVNHRPSTLQWQTGFPCKSPKGAVVLRFASGLREGKSILALDTILTSSGSDLPSMPDGFGDWLRQAYELTEDWFFTLIEGDLLRKFSGE